MNMNIKQWNAATQWFVVEHCDGAGIEITGCFTTPGELMKNWCLYLSISPDLYERNSVKDLTQWVHRTIEDSTLDEVQRDLCVKVGLQMASKGAWRGDISEVWKDMGFTMLEIPDMYP